MAIALRQAGFRVFSTHKVGGGFPDLVVAGIHRHYGIPFIVLVEVKSTKSSRLTEDEEAFFLMFQDMPVIVATSPSDVALAFGWSPDDAIQLNAKEYQHG